MKDHSFRSKRKFFEIYFVIKFNSVFYYKYLNQNKNIKIK
jgi:hypothetical protein